MDWNQFIGRFHPLIVHLPIGIFILGYFFEFLYQLGYRNAVTSRKIIIKTYSLGLLSGILAALTGWLLSLNDDYGIEPLNDHKYLGIATLVVMLATIIYQVKGAEEKGKLKLVFSSVAILLIALTGHFGGNLTHGPHYLVEYGPDFLKNENAIENKLPNQMNSDSVLIYANIIRPILDNKCTACHNSENKKGGLSLQTYANLFKQSDHKLPIKAGNPYESELFSRVSLPLNHEKAMPPRGAGFGYTDLQILKYWIENGADSLAVFNSDVMSEDLIALINRDYGLDYSPKPYYETVNVDRLNEELLEQLRNSGFRVNYLSKTNFLLDVTFKNDSISMENIKLLNEISDHVTILSLINCSLNDELVKKISSMKHLTRIDFSNNKLLTKGVEFLPELKHLESVNFNETSLTFNALQSILSENDDLRIYIRNTSITTEEYQTLKQTFTKAEIISEFAFEEVEKAKSVFR